MPVQVQQSTDIQPGDIYEDSMSHPCLCTRKEGDELFGISLIDGSYPRSEDLKHHSIIRTLTIEEAWHWRLYGPRDKTLSVSQRWWEPKSGALLNPAAALENLYFFALYQVEWNEDVVARLGAPILHEWHDVSALIEDRGKVGIATISFTVKGANQSGVVHVKAHKTGQDWLFDSLYVDLGQQLLIKIITNGGGAAQTTASGK